MADADSSHLIWKWRVQAITPKVDQRADTQILSALESSLGLWNRETPDNHTVTRSQLKKLMEEGCVIADSAPVKPNSKLKTHAEVQITFPPPVPTELVPEDRPIEILYEDSHLLVVNKPQGLTVHPSPTQMEGTLVHALLHHIKDLSGIGGVLRPGIVHRIDKDTSGALVITKTDAAHTRLAEIFATHSIERVYWALVYGAPPTSKTATKIESLIGRSPTDRKKMSMTVKEGRKAITYFKKLEEYAHSHKKPFASWLEVTLETGRTHQVRVHLTGTGHSILGDPVYGVPSSNHPKWVAIPNEIRALIEKLPGQALHARVLGFEHPITGQKLHFEAEPPMAFQALLKACQHYG